MSRREKLPGLREERSCSLLYLVATVRSAILPGWRRDTLPRHSAPFSPLPREGDVEGVEKIADKEVGKLRGRRGREGTRVGRQVSLALVQGAWHSESDPLKFNF